MRLVHKGVRKVNASSAVGVLDFPTKPKVENRKPNAPTDLKPHAKKFWKQIIEQTDSSLYNDKGVLAALRTLCATYQEWMELNAIVDLEGVVIKEEMGDGRLKTVVHPAARMRADSAKRLQRMLIEFGLTPRSQGFSAVTKTGNDSDPTSAFFDD